MATLLHPERYSLSNVVSRKLGVVVHTSESNDDTQAVVLRLLASPGDRVIEGSSPPRKYGSGYHAVTNGHGSYTQVADANQAPYAAPPLNKTFWHVCIPGRAGQTREQWLDPISRGDIIGVAHFIVDRWRVDQFPLDRIFALDLRLGHGGYCGHVDVSHAWPDQTNHTDPGVNFPWDVLALEIAWLLSTPPPIPSPVPWSADMTVRLITPTDGGKNLDAAVFATDGLTCQSAVSGPNIEAWIAAGVYPPKVAGKLPVANVDRGALRSMQYVGPLPDYSQTPPSLPSRTTRAHFAPES